MFSLRIAILLALSSRLDSYAVSGYSVVVPHTYDHAIPETETHESATTAPHIVITPVPETTIPTLLVDEPVPITTLPPPVVQQNLTISGPPHRKGTTACLCKECNTDDGCVIKHYRQYNYYYPNGQKVSIPFNKPAPIKANELSASGLPVSSGIQMTNNNGRVTVQTVTKPAPSFNLPGVFSYVPQNGHNFVYNPAVLGLHQSAPLYNSFPTYIPRPLINGLPAPSNMPAEDKNEPAPVDEPATPCPTDNVDKDIITYLSDPNVFGQTTMTVVKNGNNPQHVSMSSMVQSQSQHPLPVPGFQSNIDYLGGTPATAELLKPNFHYFNPLPQPHPLFQRPNYNIPPVYSVVV